jgi:hypothetical protein
MCKGWKLGQAECAKLLDLATIPGMSDSPEPKKTERLVVMVTKEDLKALDDWRYEQQIPSRGEAARRLISLGLETAKKRKVPKKGS